MESRRNNDSRDEAENLVSPFKDTIASQTNSHGKKTLTSFFVQKPFKPFLFEDMVKPHPLIIKKIATPTPPNGVNTLEPNTNPDKFCCITISIATARNTVVYLKDIKIMLSFTLSVGLECTFTNIGTNKMIKDIVRYKIIIKRSFLLHLKKFHDKYINNLVMSKKANTDNILVSTNILQKKNVDTKI